MTRQDYPDYGLTIEQRRQACVGHYYEYPGMDGKRGEIWCYTRAYAYRPGDEVDLHISSTASVCSIMIERDGADLIPVLHAGNIATTWQETPDQCSVTGCGWKPSFAFRVDPSWTSGAYRITLTAEGRDGKPITCQHLIIVRPLAGNRKGRILQIAATGTWTAYNTWGGSNHYQGITGPNRDQYATTVSIERPFCRGFVTLPPDAPRVPLEITPPPGVDARYPHMEWAYAKGYSKKYASAGWASYDSHFFRWAERAGYAIDLASQHQLHFEPELLAGYDCVVFVGHDEYWTWAMRDAVDNYVENGGHIARFAGNFMWQTRFEDDGQRQVCYKYRARAEDPVYKTGDVKFATNSWEAPEIGRPGAQTFGLNAAYGVYTGWGSCGSRDARGFPIYRPGHWSFAGTGLSYGDVLGRDSHVFGYEVDGLAYVIRNGLPEPTGEGSPPDGIEILALGLASLSDNPSQEQFLNDEDLRFVASTIAGNEDPETLDHFKRGSGMIVNFKKGKGEVYHAGSGEWVAGLLRADPMVEKVTANVLDKYLKS